jgi:hypothetical protein
MVKTLAATGAVLLGLTACSDAGSDDDAKAARSLSQVVSSNTNAASGFDIDQSGADCIGKGLVDEFGTQRLVELGFLTQDLEAADNVQLDNLPADDAEKFVDAFTTCVDVPKLIIDAMKQDPAFAALPESVVTCIEGALTDEAAKAALLDQFRGTTEAQDKLQQDLLACVPLG